MQFGLRGACAEISWPQQQPVLSSSCDPPLSAVFTLPVTSHPFTSRLTLTLKFRFEMQQFTRESQFGSNCNTKPTVSMVFIGGGGVYVLHVWNVHVLKWGLSPFWLSKSVLLAPFAHFEEHWDSSTWSQTTKITWLALSTTHLDIVQYLCADIF